MMRVVYDVRGAWRALWPGWGAAGRPGMWSPWCRQTCAHVFV